MIIMKKSKLFNLTACLTLGGVVGTISTISTSCSVSDLYWHELKIKFVSNFETFEDVVLWVLNKSKTPIVSLEKLSNETWWDFRIKGKANDLIGGPFDIEFENSRWIVLSDRIEIVDGTISRTVITTDVTDSLEILSDTVTKCK